MTEGNATPARWLAEFDCATGRDEALIQQIGQGVFQAAFTALEARITR